MTKEFALVLGGARAGKSAFAQGLAQQGQRRVLFVATAEAGDAEMAERIAQHRHQRPVGWDTLEEPLDLSAALEQASPDYDTILLDCLTLWVSNLLGRKQGMLDVATETQRLLDVYEAGKATWIVVSNEVGLGVVPPSELGRRYRDALGRVNQLVARRANRVYLVVAGLALDLKTAGARSIEMPRGGV